MLPTIALSMTIFLTACVDRNAQRLAEARAEQARADLVDEALAVAELPELPADCRRREASGVEEGDRLDVALLKAERAIGRGNARVSRCAAWHDDLRATP